MYLQRTLGDNGSGIEFDWAKSYSYTLFIGHAVMFKDLGRLHEYGCRKYDDFFSRIPLREAFKTC